MTLIHFFLSPSIGVLSLIYLLAKTKIKYDFDTVSKYCKTESG